MSTETAVAIDERENTISSLLAKNTDDINKSISIINSKITYYPSLFKFCNFRVAFLDEKTIKIYNWDNIVEFFGVENINSEHYNKIYSLFKVENNTCVIERSNLKSMNNLYKASNTNDYMLHAILNHVFFLEDKKAFLNTENDLVITVKTPRYNQVQINGSSFATFNRIGMHGYFFANDLISISIKTVQKKYAHNDYTNFIGGFTLSEYPTCCGLMMVYGFSQAKNEYEYMEPLINNLGHAAGFSRFIFVNNNISRYDDYKKKTLTNKLRKLIDFTNKRNTNKLGIFSQSITKYV